MTFSEKLNARMDKVNSLLCVGLDEADFEFNKTIIDKTHEYVCAYKPNLAFYEADNWGELRKTMEYLKKFPDIVTIADAKRADIGNTNEAYAESIFDVLSFDAVTLHPYLGQEALEPFLRREEKGCIILCRTSNPGAGEFQDLLVDGEPLWMRVAKHVSTKWNTRGNCGLVVGATYPEELSKVRNAVGDLPILCPGIGAQGGDVAAAVKAGIDSSGRGLMMSISRSILFADDPGKAALEMREEINRYR